MPELHGDSNVGWAVWGASSGGTGAAGTAEGWFGVGSYGQSTNSYGVWGKSNSGTACSVPARATAAPACGEIAPASASSALAITTQASAAIVGAPSYLPRRALRYSWELPRPLDGMMSM